MIYIMYKVSLGGIYLFDVISIDYLLELGSSPKLDFYLFWYVQLFG